VALIAMPAAVVIAVVLALTGSSGGEPSAAQPTAQPARAHRFDGDRAWRLLKHQVAIGPRPAGSPQLRELAEYIRARIPRGHFEDVPGHPGLRNVVGRIKGAKPAVAVAAHYDTKDLPGFVGANDGAGGTAAVMEIARALRHAKRPKGAPEIRFLFLDGEEATDDDDFLGTGVRGAKAYAKAHAKELRALVLLDFVAEKGAMRIPREQGSDPKLWARLRSAAKRAGSGASFPGELSGQVLDDHTPFTQRGVPSIDLIDFTFPCWHKTCDDLSAVSERSLDRSGEAVLEMLRSWR
jgi:glutaminyl-peptide cyclotransferase